MLTHDNMLRNAWAAGTRVGVRAEDRYFNCRPFFHVAGTTLSALMSLVFGACLVTLPTFEAGAALEMMERERCTLDLGQRHAVPDADGPCRFPEAQVEPARRLVGGRPETMRAIIDRMGCKTICAAYGLSEASPNVVMSDWRDPEELRVQGLAKPHDGVEVRIVDGRDPGARLEHHARLLQQPGGHRQGVHRRRLAAHRRSRQPHARRPPAHDRPAEGCVPRRRRERGAGRGGGGAARASGGADGAGHRRAGRAPGRSGLCLRHIEEWILDERRTN